MTDGRNFDVVVAGGGVIGAFVARELSRSSLRVCVAEAAADVAMGSSGANSGIVHGGFDPDPGTLKAKFNVEGCRMMPEVTSQLDVPFKMIGSLVAARSAEEMGTLDELMRRGRANGVQDLELLDAAALHRLEPRLDPQLCGALYCPHSGIVCPYELTQAAMENAVANGVTLLLDAPVTGLQALPEGGFAVTAGAQRLTCRAVVNAAGLFSDQLYQLAVQCCTDEAQRALAQQRAFHVIPKVGEYQLLDKAQGATVSHVIFRTPTAAGKGILVSPTVDGNLLLGPTSVPRTGRGDTSTTPDGLAQVRAGAQLLVPDVALRDVITSFAGLRASVDRPEHDFIVGRSPVAGFYNAAGIESPGLTSAPAIGAWLARLVASDLGAQPREGFDPIRRHLRFRELDEAAQRRLVEQNPAYGHIICRCETITEGEILDAIRRPCGARTLDGVKRRTRAGMGRCQGGFCSPRVVELLSRELHIDPTQVRKSSAGSYLLTGPTKMKGEEKVD